MKYHRLISLHATEESAIHSIHRFQESFNFTFIHSSPVFILNNLGHDIKDSHKEEELEPAKMLVKYMSFQNDPNLNKLGKNKDSVLKLTEGKNESEKVDLILEKIESMYGGCEEIRKFLDFIRKHRKEVFLCLKKPAVEKTSDKAEQHFSIQSWLFKNRFKTAD